MSKSAEGTHVIYWRESGDRFYRIHERAEALGLTVPYYCRLLVSKELLRTGSDGMPLAEAPLRSTNEVRSAWPKGQSDQIDAGSSDPVVGDPAAPSASRRGPARSKRVLASPRRDGGAVPLAPVSTHEQEPSIKAAPKADTKPSLMSASLGRESMPSEAAEPSTTSEPEGAYLPEGDDSDLRDSVDGLGRGRR